MLKPACSAFQRKRTNAGLALTAKLLLIMKLTAILLLAAGLTASAHGHSQKVSLRVKDAPIEEVFRSLKKQTGYNFVYANDVLTQAKPVNLSISNSTLDEVLLLLFKSQPLSYAVVDKVVVVKVSLVSPKENMGDEAVVLPPIEITGKVTTKEGEPLAGASVVIKRTGRGTQTDANGNFKLTGVEAGDVLTISYTGYTQKTVKVGDSKSFLLALEVATNELDQVIIQAYGTTTNRINTGNIAKVTAAEIERQPVINPLQALQGRVPGLIVSQTNGYASAPFKVELRGRNSIDRSGQSGEPFYIIDGIPFTIGGPQNSNHYGASSILVGGYGGPANGQSPLFGLNPSDIESIEILKDADATAIYGSRGANGVILITSKKGKIGKKQFDVNISQGFNKVSRYYDLLNTEQYVAMRREAFQNEGIYPPPGFFAPDIMVWDTTRYTDWQKILFGNTGKFTNAQLSLTAGTANSQFRISGGYMRSTDILSVSGASQVGSLQANLFQKVTSRLSMSTVIKYSYSINNLVSLSGNAILLPPTAPSIYDSIGKLNWKGWEPISGQYPFASLLQPYEAKTNILLSNLSFDYNIGKGLFFNTSFGYTDTRNEQIQKNPRVSMNPLSSTPSGSVFGKNAIRNWNIDPQLSYSGFIGKGRISILLGTSVQQNVSDGYFLYATGFSNDALLGSLTAATAVTVGSDVYSKYVYAGLYGRINYNWINKFIINLSARRDGSSRFGPDKQFGNFGALGTAWVFSEEKWIKGKIPFLSFGKLRASYGVTGSDGIGDYQFLSRWQGTLAYQGNPALYPTQHSNPDFQWQTNKKLEAAIALGFLKDRITFNASWYRNRCNNQLVGYPLPYVSGFPSVTSNSPASVENTGWEFTLNTRSIENKSFSWALSANLGLNRNKLLDFPNLSQSPYANTYVIGKSLNLSRLLHFTGVDLQTGLYQFDDKTKNGLLSVTPGTDDDRYIYEINPVFSGGVGNDLRWKQFTLSCFLRFVKQMGFNVISNSGFAGQPTNASVNVLNRWQNPNDIADFARFSVFGGQSYNYYTASDATLTDASFIRLQNLYMGYEMTGGKGKRPVLKGCKIFLQAENLFVITKYDGIDPETQNFGGMPPLKVFSGGINLNF